MPGEDLRVINIEHVRGWRINNADQGRWYAVNIQHGAVLGPFDTYQEAIPAFVEFDAQHGVSDERGTT